jgi:virulence factor Mce-like protein
MPNLRMPTSRNHRLMAAGVVLVVLIGALMLLPDGAGTKKVSAKFSRAVSVYVGTDVRVLGVNVGKVTRVTPAGNAVRVDMEYDGNISLPANAKAVVVTPTLVADRFVQLTPAYTRGAVMADDALIELADTGVPVELDRIYASLSELSVALGPSGVNKDGTLNRVLATTARALDGKGAQANKTIVDLAAAAKTFGAGSGDLFATVEQLASFTDALATNDKLVRTFLVELTGVSAQLAGERMDIQRAVAAVARSVGTIERFVGDNRAALMEAVKRLTKVTGTVASEQASISEALRTGPLAIGNLTLAYNSQTSTIGSRITIQNQVADLDGFLCAMVQQQASLPKVTRDLACRLFEQLQPVQQQVLDGATRTASTPEQSTPGPTLGVMMGGAR